MIPALTPIAAAGGGTPLNYADVLKLFLESETDVATSGSDVTSWTDQVGSLAFTVPGSQVEPTLLSATQNGFDGVSFEQLPAGGSIRRMLGNAANALDNFWAGSGDKSIAFAGRLDDIENTTLSNNVIASKRNGGTSGWSLEVTRTGTFTFRSYRTNGSRWELSASGFYSEDDLVLGTVVYNGGNSTGSGTAYLWNGSNFVETGSVTVGTTSAIADDSAIDLIIGNQGPSSPGCFGGPLFAVWMTKPAQISLDQGYLARYLP